MALDHGLRGMAALQALYHVLTKPIFSQNISLSNLWYRICHTLISNPQLIIDKGKQTMPAFFTSLCLSLYIIHEVSSMPCYSWLIECACEIVLTIETKVWSRRKRIPANNIIHHTSILL